MENNFNSIKNYLMTITKTGNWNNGEDSLKSALVKAKELSKYDAKALHTLCTIVWSPQKHGPVPFTLKDFDKLESVKASVATPITWALPLGPTVSLSPKDMNKLTDGEWEIGEKTITLDKGLPTSDSTPLLKTIYEDAGLVYTPIPAAAAVERAAKVLSYYVTVDVTPTPKNFPKTCLPYYMNNSGIAQGMSIIASGIPNPGKKMKATDVIIWAIQNSTNYYSKKRSSDSYLVNGKVEGKSGSIKLVKGALFAYEVLELFKDLNSKFELGVSVKDGKLNIKTKGFTPPPIPGEDVFTSADDFNYYTCSQFRDRCRLARGTDEGTACEINKSFYTCVNMAKSDVNDLRLFTDVFTPLNNILGETTCKSDTLFFETTGGAMVDKLMALKSSLVESEVLGNIKKKQWVLYYATYNTQVATRCAAIGIDYVNSAPKNAIHVKLHDVTYNPPKVTTSYNFVSDVTKIFGLDTKYYTVHTDVPVVEGVPGGYISTPIIHNLRAMWTNLPNVKFLDFPSYYRASVCVNWARNCQVGSGHNIMNTRAIDFFMKLRGQKETVKVTTDTCRVLIKPLMGRYATTVFKKAAYKQAVEMFDIDYDGDAPEEDGPNMDNGEESGEGQESDDEKEESNNQAPPVIIDEYD